MHTYLIPWVTILYHLYLSCCSSWSILTQIIFYFKDRDSKNPSKGPSSVSGVRAGGTCIFPCWVECQAPLSYVVCRLAAQEWEQGLVRSGSMDWDWNFWWGRKGPQASPVCLIWSPCCWDLLQWQDQCGSPYSPSVPQTPKRKGLHVRKLKGLLP